MRLDKGKRLFIRSLVNVCAEPIPFFWNMRNFIHHNPLYGLEHLPFEDAVRRGSRLFHAQDRLPREHYIKLFREGHIEEGSLKEEIAEFLKDKDLKGLKAEELLFRLSTEGEGLYLSRNSYINCRCPEAERLAKRVELTRNLQEEAEGLSRMVGKELTIYDAIDGLFGRGIARKLDELLIKVCAEFLDEGQAVWGMPGRDRGLYRAWRDIAVRNRRYRLKGCCGVGDVLKECEEPEEAVVFVLNAFGVPEDIWEDYITLELSKLHGWTGYVRWRSNTKEYYWQIKHPADLTDYLAVRLLLSMALVKEEEKTLPVGASLPEIREFISDRGEEAIIRWEFHRGECPPHLTDAVEEAIEENRLEDIRERYEAESLRAHRLNWASFLLRVWDNAGYERESLLRMDRESLNELMSLLREYEEEEGFIWLRAHEKSVLKKLLSEIRLKREVKGRAFAQALFCIDVRSERFRRNLEEVGDYETYGIAGFFGVPISFIELGKGHETYLCPVLIKPKNVVLELHRELKEEGESLGKVIKEILHDLKHNILTPYITVEAIGLLFGFDMVGKTLFPLGYGRLREKLSEGKPSSRLMIDKPSKEYVLEVIGILQREIIRRAMKERFKLSVSEGALERLRRVALEEEEPDRELAEELGVGKDKLSELVEVMRKDYRVEKGYTRIQIEKLAKIGFTTEEQAFFVERALSSIGLTRNFGKVVLVIGHGSKSDNNPYESALDCGACGGDHGAVNARVFAKMANKAEVRLRLRERGIDIPEDTVFIACEHNTTTDEVEFFDLDELPATHLPFLQKIYEDLKLAGKRTAMERCEELEGTPCKDEERTFRLAKRNSMDWTQVRPEWGLSGNYAFIIGRRELTEGLDLEGKVFLHSYDWEVDDRGMLLEIILSGPLVVGEWINMEHFFSAVDNESYGSGSKVYHNVVGRFGVMSGNFSDLKTGLPAQTVLRGKEPHHKPIRLITLIEAPLGRVKRALKGVRKVRELVHNGWINLIVLDPIENGLYRFEGGEWKKFLSKEVGV
ncbi:DUF2309 domain-containing protein [Hydrogenivirga sp.]